MTQQTDAGQAREFLVEAAQEGARLDKALEVFLPDAGLRQRRRLIEAGRVLVEGRPAPAGLKLRPGMRVMLLPDQAAAAGSVSVRIVAQTKAYAALDKPANLHSAALAGGGGASLEALLPELFPGQNPRLLNRLDFLTSGLVLAALNTRAAKVFAALDPRTVLKEYTAVVQGVLREELTLRFNLDTDDRKKTRVVTRLNQDETGWTRVWPVAALPGELSLLRVRIVSGARHQIRAHLAFAGLPIVGDPLYGAAEDGAQRMLLHHSLLEFPGFRAESKPPWLAGLGRDKVLVGQPD